MTKTRISIAACSLRIDPASAEVRILPAGQFDAPRGALSGAGPWNLTAARAQSIIERVASRSTDIVIDYEHQTLLADSNGKPAPASGWVNPKSLTWCADGIYGAVTWTAYARASIDADEYRYLSPVFTYDSNGEPIDILHVALTNTPAIDTAIPALAAARMATSTSTTQQEISQMDKTKLLEALGLDGAATDEQIMGAIATLNALAAEAKSVRKALDLDEDDDLVKKVGDLLKASSESVPKEVYDEVKAQSAALKAGTDRSELKSLIAEGLKDGRIPGKATAAWLQNQGIAACKTFLQDATPVAALSQTQTRSVAPAVGESARSDLTPADLTVCTAMGLSTDAYRKANAIT